jgi:hypothetical protein
MKNLIRRAAIGVLALVGTGMSGGLAGAATSGLIPSTQIDGGQCFVSGTSATPSHSSKTPPTLPAHPSEVKIVWLPGLYSKTCEAVLTRGNAHIA